MSFVRDKIELFMIQRHGWKSYVISLYVQVDKTVLSTYCIKLLTVTL